MTQNKKFFDRKREWSTVKDNLLTYYLKPYFTKILATGKLIIYIDGFAGCRITIHVLHIENMKSEISL